MTFFSSVTYAPERIYCRRRFIDLRWYDPTEELLDEIERFADGQDAVIAPGSTDIEVQDDIELDWYRDSIGYGALESSYWAYDLEFVTEATARAWAYRNVRPEHRSLLSSFVPSRPGQPVDCAVRPTRVEWSQVDVGP